MLRRVALGRPEVSEELFLRSLIWFIITANVVLSSPDSVTLMIEALRSSEISIITRATLCNIAEDGILHSHLRENIKSYIALTSWTQ
jgi:hypothetical protein